MFASGLLSISLCCYDKVSAIVLSGLHCVVVNPDNHHGISKWNFLFNLQVWIVLVPLSMPIDTISSSYLLLLIYFTSHFYRIQVHTVQPRVWIRNNYVIKFKNQHFNQLGYCPWDNSEWRTWIQQQHISAGRLVLKIQLLHSELSHGALGCKFGNMPIASSILTLILFSQFPV